MIENKTIKQKEVNNHNGRYPNGRNLKENAEKNQGVVRKRQARKKVATLKSQKTRFTRIQIVEASIAQQVAILGCLL